MDEVCEDIATMEPDQEESTYAHNRGLENIYSNANVKETAEVELEIPVGIFGEIIEEDEDEDHEHQDEDKNCEDEIEKLLNRMCAD